MRAALAVMLTVAIFGLTYGLSAPLIALRLSAVGYSEAAIGINAAMHALGVLLIAPALPMLARRLAAKTLMLTALLSLVVLFLLFPLLPLWSWFLLRLLVGMASEVILVVAETWLNHQAVDAQRARTMAAYTAMLSLGFALGPLLIGLLGSGGAAAFLSAAALALLAAASLLSVRLSPLPAGRETRRSLVHWLRLIPLALGATLLNAALESAGMNLLAIYAISLGWSEAAATQLIAVLLLGAIVLQLPIGWLADRLPRRPLMTGLALISTLGAVAWPLVLAHPVLAWSVLFLWGGVFVGIYTLIITLVGERFQGATLAGVYAMLSVAWGLGALIGPALAGWAMTVTPHGLAWFAAVGCGAFTLQALFASPQRT
ncbi:MFS transporter [Pantoea sp. 1.19]|uniref:MFS transporter n=1 Tax=Pantoea sp. 1.19 TaxID=1925589 RepID=UPI000948F275|nr:MFS transporter [Pantoea sp. 1.19]